VLRVAGTQRLVDAQDVTGRHVSPWGLSTFRCN
jgi:hypothetical protein